MLHRYNATVTVPTVVLRYNIRAPIPKYMYLKSCPGFKCVRTTRVQISTLFGLSQCDSAEVFYMLTCCNNSPIHGTRDILMYGSLSKVKAEIYATHGFFPGSKYI